MSARTIRRRLQQRGLVPRRPLLRLPLTLHHRRMRLQWCVERRTWTTEWHDIIFSDESRFCLQHHDGRIRVWRHRGERLYDTCIRHRHTARHLVLWCGAQLDLTPAPVWFALPAHPIATAKSLTFCSLLSSRTCRTCQRPRFNRTMRARTWRVAVARLSTDMSPIEHVWSLIGNRVVRQVPPAAAPDELWHRVEAAWTDIPQAQIRSLFLSMPRRVAAVIASHGGHTNY
ncbi:hypothetical protein JGG47_23220 [Salmonella enterica subsp. enterica serovar Derby]|nr:hypothetical protein [Salmonella enterica subsp. enterica serovar Derby]